MTLAGACKSSPVSVTMAVYNSSPAAMDPAISNDPEVLDVFSSYETVIPQAMGTLSPAAELAAVSPTIPATADDEPAVSNKRKLPDSEVAPAPPEKRVNQENEETADTTVAPKETDGPQETTPPAAGLSVITSDPDALPRMHDPNDPREIRKQQKLERRRLLRQELGIREDKEEDIVSSSSDEDEEHDLEQALLEGIEEDILICSNCQSNNFIEDSKQGDMVCTDCGMVQEARIVSQDIEYRLFEGDIESRKKMRIGAAYNHYLRHNFFGSKRKWERDEKEFLWDGLENIDDVLNRVFLDEKNQVIENRAKELFQQAFHWQYLQKQGYESKVRGNKFKSRKVPEAPRKKFSRRKQFVVACIWQALRENGITGFDIQDISRVIDGKEVSKASIQLCLKDLGLW